MQVRLENSIFILKFKRIQCEIMKQQLMQNYS